MSTWLLSFWQGSWNDFVLSKVCIIKYCFKISIFSRTSWVSLSFTQDKDKQACFNVFMWFSKISIDYMIVVLSLRLYGIMSTQIICFFVDVECTPWQRFFQRWWTCTLHHKVSIAMKYWLHWTSPTQRRFVILVKIFNIYEMSC